MYCSLLKPYSDTTMTSKVKLSQHDARVLLLLIQMRQQDIRRVTPEFPMYSQAQQVDFDLEKVKA